MASPQNPGTTDAGAPPAPRESRRAHAGAADNPAIAARLREAADILLAQGDGPFRARAYRRAADAILGLRQALAAIAARGGQPALEAIPGIGRSIAAAIAEMLTTGRWSYLERLRGAAEPERLFRQVPGIGPGLARRLHEDLHIETLAELEVAAHDGHLAALPHFGERRAAAVRGALAAMLGRLRPVLPIGPTEEPAVRFLLDVDREYRERAGRDDLPRIAPKRFNPSGEAWLPVLHTRRGAWQVTALFSNTALAHRLGTVRDWVVIYFHRDGTPEGRRTVVTETRGAAHGTRTVRGREAECTALAAEHRASRQGCSRGEEASREQ